MGTANRAPGRHGHSDFYAEYMGEIASDSDSTQHDEGTEIGGDLRFVPSFRGKREAVDLPPNTTVCWQSEPGTSYYHFIAAVIPRLKENAHDAMVFEAPPRSGGSDDDGCHLAECFVDGALYVCNEVRHKQPACSSFFQGNHEPSTVTNSTRTSRIPPGSSTPN